MYEALSSKAPHITIKPEIVIYPHTQQTFAIPMLAFWHFADNGFTTCFLWLDKNKPANILNSACLINSHNNTFPKAAFEHVYLMNMSKSMIYSQIFSEKKAKFSWLYYLLQISHLTLVSLKILSFSVSGLGAQPIWQLNCAHELQREPNICPHFVVACSRQTFMH